MQEMQEIVGSIPGSGRSPGGGNGNLLSYSCLKSPMDRGTWRVIVHGVTKSQTQLKQLITHAHKTASIIYFFTSESVLFTIKNHLKQIMICVVS